MPPLPDFLMRALERFARPAVVVPMLREHYSPTMAKELADYLKDERPEDIPFIRGILSDIDTYLGDTP